MLDHYAPDVQQTPNLDPVPTSGITISVIRTVGTKAFLNTLNDEEFVKDSWFQDLNKYKHKKELALYGDSDVLVDS